MRERDRQVVHVQNTGTYHTHHCLYIPLWDAHGQGRLHSVLILSPTQQYLLPSGMRMFRAIPSRLSIQSPEQCQVFVFSRKALVQDMRCNIADSFPCTTLFIKSSVRHWLCVPLHNIVYLFPCTALFIYPPVCRTKCATHRSIWKSYPRR